MRSFKKMLLGAVATLVLAAGVAASPASATVPTEGKFNAQANVPYLAWRGEHIRLGYCEPDGRISPFAHVTWHIEDWSGDPANGSIPVPYLLEQHWYNGCEYAEFTSQKAGVAMIKLEVNDSFLISRTPGETQVDKSFLAAWMQIQGPVLTGGGDVFAGDLNCQVNIDQTTNELVVQEQADPFRVCPLNFDPRHRVTATVKGIIPLDANFDEWDFSAHPLVHPGQLTLPDDWNAWANVAANDEVDRPNAIIGNPAVTNWDIHDSIASALDNHVATGGTQCDPPEVNPAGSTDTVDNCPRTVNLVTTFGHTHGAFSTVFGVLSRDGFSDGPFDPLYTNDTMLSDGVVDAGDAPMPAAQIDLGIIENIGGTDKGGVGYFLDPTDPSNPPLLTHKSEPYSRDTLGTDAAHNYDSPFYYQYLPATSRPIDAAGSPYGAVQPTGVDGASLTGGFSGFENSDPLYRNWDFAWSTTYHPGTASTCLDHQSVFGEPDPQYRPLPYGKSAVTVYSDEHGEADVWYVPGLGYYFPHNDSNGGCDLIVPPHDPLGNAHIVVTARYPYQNPTIGDPSATLDFTVHSKWAKTLAVFPKGGINNLYTRIVVAHAQDIDGSPLENETVCWTSNDLQAGSITAFPSGPGGDIYASYLPDGTPVGDVILHIDPSWAQDPNHSFINAGRFCTTTDALGNTAIEFSESHQANIDVIAHWVNEALTRDIPVAFTETPTNTGQTLADTGPVSHIPTPTQIKAAAAATAAGTVGPVLADGSKPKTKVIKSVKLKTATHKVRLARVYTPFHGKRVLQIRVNGKAGMVAIQVTVKAGKKSHVYKRFVLANHNVTVKNLPIPVKTAKVIVSLIG